MPYPRQRLLQWQDAADGKQPYYFTHCDEQPVPFAGLWVSRRDDLLMAMVITQANEFVAEVHERMPIILEVYQFEPWLTRRAGGELLKPAANDVLQRWPVSKRVK
jgi:putative SOS response-associated peptidase YedK